MEGVVEGESTRRPAFVQSSKYCVVQRRGDAVWGALSVVFCCQVASSFASFICNDMLAAVENASYTATG
jgi:hypothetical protein